MATINGVICNITKMQFASKNRNQYIPSLNSARNTVDDDNGYDGYQILLIGFEETQAKYDEVIASFMDIGEHLLVIKTGWEYRVFSVELNQSLEIGITDNFFPYTLTMLTETPYVYTTTDTSRIKTITTNEQEWSADNSAVDIDTDGFAPAPVDVKITSSATPSAEQASLAQLESY